MGIKRTVTEKHNLAFIVLIALYIILLNFRLDFTLGWDESRHSVQGHLFYDYFRTLLGGDFMGYSRFISLYSEKGISPGMGYNAGWYGFYDPPAHAIFQGLVFMLFGDSVRTARLATHLLIVLLSPFLYMLASEILGSRKLGLAATFLYLSSYLAYFYGRLVFLSVPISLCMSAWYYFSFHSRGRRLGIRFSKKIRLGIKLNYVYAGLFLAAATMMKYQSLIFAGAFMAVYLAYLSFRAIRKTGVSTFAGAVSSLRSSEAWDYAKGFALQAAVVFIIGWRWVRLSLFEMGFFERILHDGTQFGTRSIGLGYFFEFFKQTILNTALFDTGLSYKLSAGGQSVSGMGILPFLLSLSWFSLVPAAVWLFRREGSFVSRNPRLIIYILTVYVTATLLLSNRQLRYLIHVMPFVFILVVEGMRETADYLRKRLRFRHLFTIMVLVSLAFYVYADLSITERDTEEYGVYSDELVRHMSSLEKPVLLLNIMGRVEPSVTGYYHNPDLFIFESMLANDEHNPARMAQYSSYINWVAISSNYREMLSQIAELDSQINVLIVVFKYDTKDLKMVDLLAEELDSLGFRKTELRWYYVFEK